MISRPRVPRARRSTILFAVVVAALAFPLGVLANHQFADVPTAASYHDDVEALVDAGITSGCGGGNYCPGSPVTRGQMAQFLNRLGDLDGASTPSVNADTVDDWQANSLTRASYNSTASLLDGDAAAAASLTANITAPAPGWLLIDSTAEIFNEGDPSEDVVHCQLEVDNTIVPGTSQDVDTDFDATVNVDEVTCSPSGGFEVCGGAHSVELAVSGVSADSNVFDASVTVQYIPFNGVGNAKPFFPDCLIIIPFEEQQDHVKDAGPGAR